MKKQFELAKLITGSIATYEQIENEVKSLTDKIKNQMGKKLDKLLKEHDKSIDQGWDCLKEDFSVIATEYNIDKASLFAIYMSWLRSQIHGEKWDMK